MASIFQLRNNIWRAQIYVGGVRESATFDQKFQAETWAHEREAALRAIHRSIVAAHRTRNDKKLFMEASATYSEDDILKSSMSVPDTSGVYFLIRDGVIVYVGQSKSVYARLAKHKATKQFDRVAVLECKESDLLSLEALYIKKFQPVLNIVGIVRRTEHDWARDALGVETAA